MGYNRLPYYSDDGSGGTTDFLPANNNGAHAQWVDSNRKLSTGSYILQNSQKQVIEMLVRLLVLFWKP